MKCELNFNKVCSKNFTRYSTLKVWVQEDVLNDSEIFHKLWPIFKFFLACPWGESSAFWWGEEVSSLGIAHERHHAARLNTPTQHFKTVIKSVFINTLGDWKNILKQRKLIEKMREGTLF